MKELIQKLESAAEGSRELSDEVLLAMGYTYRREWNGWHLIHPNNQPVQSRDPTRSLSDTVALVPEGWWWSLDGPQGFPPYDRSRAVIMVGDQEQGSPPTFAAAATPALALSAAIARAKMEGS